MAVINVNGFDLHPTQVAAIQEILAASGVYSVDTAPPLTAGNRAVRSWGEQGGLTNNAALADTSYHLGMTTECPYQAVKVSYLNYSSSAAVIGACAMAAGNAMSFTPSGPWLVAETNIALARNISDATGSPVRAAVPFRSQMGWQNLPSIPRAVSSYLRDFNLRTYIPAIGAGNLFATLLGANSTLSSFGTGGDASIPLGRNVICARKAGDFVSSNQAGFAGYSIYGLAPLCIVEFLTDRKVMTVMGDGDSVLHGVGGDDLASYGHFACVAISTEQQPVFWDNRGVPSTNSADFLIRLQNILAHGYRPQVLLYSPFSVNDGAPTTDTIAAQRFRFAQVRDLCMQYGIILAVVNGVSFPGGGWTSGQDALRVAYNTELAGLEAQGIYVCDLASEWQTTALPAAWKPGDSIDDAHPSIAAKKRAGAGIVASMLARIKPRCFI